MNGKKHASIVLVCPLSWGFGHISRCIPIIENLLSNNVLVILAVSKFQISNVKFSNENVIFETLNGFNLRYSKVFPVWFMVLLQLPKIIFSQLDDRKKIKKLLHKYHVEKIITDNHYGSIFKKIPTVFITHQLTIKLPKPFCFLEPVFYWLHKIIIRNAYEYWIPDVNSLPNFTGELSHKYKTLKNTYFIGLLSQIQTTIKECKVNQLIDKQYKYELLILLSGQEPQRSELENILIKQICNLPIKTAIIRGTNRINSIKIINCDMFNFADANLINDLLTNSKYVICRSGYSSLMDLVIFGKKAIIIPTPGQTEQLYLAKHISKFFPYVFQVQNRVKLLEGFNKLDNLPSKQIAFNSDVRVQRIKNLINIPNN